MKCFYNLGARAVKIKAAKVYLIIGKSSVRRCFHENAVKRAMNSYEIHYVKSTILS